MLDSNFMIIVDDKLIYVVIIYPAAEHLDASRRGALGSAGAGAALLIALPLLPPLMSDLSYIWKHR